MDLISITGLRVATRVGATAEERATPQPVVVDVEVRCDLRTPAATDSLDDTVDYGALVAAVTKTVESSEVALLERLAEEVALTARRQPRVSGVTVTIGKEQPPVPQDVTSVTVSIER